jgi:myosin heavy subunit
MYQLDDVTHLLDEIRKIIKGHVISDLEKITQQSVLYLRQLFLQAEGNGVALNVDLSQLDDAVLLAGIEKLSLDSKKAGRPGLDSTMSLRGGALKPVEGAVDIRLVAQTKELQEANRSLLAKFEKVQSQCQNASREASELKDRLHDTEKALKTAQKDLSNLQSSNRSAQQLEIESLRSEVAASKESAARQLSDLKAELKSSSDAFAAKVNQAPQYLQLKKLMNTKNEQLKEARARVKVLEEGRGD